MGRVARIVRGEAQKGIAKIVDKLSGRYSGWEIWQDFIVMTAISLANVVDGPYMDEREKTYLDRARKYKPDELEAIAEMVALIVTDMERDPDQDFLGELFMSLGLGDEWKGQFFTPYNVCRMMAAMSFGDDLKSKIEKKGWIGVNDPACGAGALLIAFANECRRQKVNYQTSVLFVAQDIDFLAGMMCYIQLSLMGCPGYVVIGDTLSNPCTSLDKRGLIPKGGSNIWYTPMYYTDIWQYRRVWSQMDLFISSAAAEAKETPKPELQQEAEPEFAESKAGQLSLF